MNNIVSMCIADTDGDGDCQRCAKYGETAPCRRWVRSEWWVDNQIIPVELPSDRLLAARHEKLEHMKHTATTNGWCAYKNTPFEMTYHRVYVWTVHTDEFGDQPFAGDYDNFVKDVGREPTDDDVRYLWYQYKMRVWKLATPQEIEGVTKSAGASTERTD